MTAPCYNGGMLNLRNASANDIPVILQFIRELAEYEKAPEQAVATAEDLRRDGFTANPKFHVLIAEWEGEPAGFALFFYHYSTWVGRPTLFLEDVFVRPRFRGKGIGKALLLRLAKVAVDEGCGRFEWQVLDWNTPAIEFYQSLGAKVMKEWLTMRVSGEELRALASQDEQDSGFRSQETEEKTNYYTAYGLLNRPSARGINLFGRLAHHYKWRSFSPMTRCVTEYLGQGHQELSQLLNELQEELQVLPLARDLESTSERLQGLSKKLAKVLHAHIKQEEQILYPALEGHMQGLAATLERMRRENSAGGVMEKAFVQCIEQLAKSGKNRQEVMKRGRNYVQWVRGHLLKENGRLFPLVERGLDPETQQKVRRAMEELSQKISSPVAEGTLSGQA